MKFEEALTKMRNGAKIKNPFFEEDVYFQACRIGLIFDDSPKDSWPISIVKMQGDRQHIDMKPSHRCDKHGIIPQLPLCLVMSDDWMVEE
jgi:hypothetical protein